MSLNFVDFADQRRTSALVHLDPEKQAQRGQYFTPHSVACIIAGLFRVPEGRSIRVLDPGAGTGILSAALIDRLRIECPDAEVHIVAVENDPLLHPALAETLSELESVSGVSTELVDSDFLPWSLSTDKRFDLVVQNPPYAKLRSGSGVQRLLRDNGIQVPNIYAAFLALGLRLLVPGGQQVAITPRSWMNGTYYSDFRHSFVRDAGIDAIYTFESRSRVFGDLGVLQESIIVAATLGIFPDKVLVQASFDHNTEPSSRDVDYSEIVTPDFIYVPATEKDAEAVAWMTAHVNSTLADLGLTVSTGRVVDFRSREMLHFKRAAGAVPMVNASHLRGGIVHHPIGAKKPEWFHSDPASMAKFVVPGGSYVLIKRFSAKEEKRRIVSAVWCSEGSVAFDNKLNYIHQDGHGLAPEIAAGLVLFLNSTRVDEYFRVFSGHTQVNATDLRMMRFPSLEQLRALAHYAVVDQRDIDRVVEYVLACEEVCV
ncbi:Eco57I restriction-modification methylase domain-containing protein [Actinomyces bowdenii]|uniref:site-specific DNA-methyltransferase (adenine-specific) n=1 Tax=Actinomyces bowdenii TaxID=131109 RepID=A0A3P1V4T5_9ACTO|nr:Eco57I restriction-modification methylase domain-containing protein [Actinomyces bowdenii]RRD28275.1 restriction endonuclease [Actinomyces bowdenii]